MFSCVWLPRALLLPLSLRHAVPTVVRSFEESDAARGNHLGTRSVQQNHELRIICAVADEYKCPNWSLSGCSLCTYALQSLLCGYDKSAFFFPCQSLYGVSPVLARVAACRINDQTPWTFCCPILMRTASRCEPRWTPFALQNCGKAMPVNFPPWSDRNALISSWFESATSRLKYSSLSSA